jgi:hypothetical protein
MIWYIFDVNSAFTVESNMNTFTLRRIPLSVERSLRRIARESHQSLNKTALELLSKATGVEPEEKPSRKRRDIASALPKWTDDEYREFQRSTKTFDSIDKEMWR